jgi:AcrR family transcriptional regulator
MARPQTVSDADLLHRLETVFGEVGYEGASLSMLAEAAGLKKASLYHRFPGGKRQMAEEVLSAARERLEAEVLAPLRAGGPVKARVAALASALDRFYDGGRRASLANLLATSGPSPFGPAIRDTLGDLGDAFTALARDARMGAKKARRRSERVLMLLEGSLVLSRGLGDTAPFRDFLDRLGDEFS